jgi:hypothetical protein
MELIPVKIPMKAMTFWRPVRSGGVVGREVGGGARDGGVPRAVIPHD